MATWRYVLDNNLDIILPSGCKVKCSDSGILSPSKTAHESVRYRNFGGRRFMAIDGDCDYFAIDFARLDASVPGFLQIVKRS